MNKNYLLIILLFVYCVGFSQYKVINVKEPLEKYPKEAGFFYSLPKNFITLHITVKKINKYKGPFSDYAENMLGVNGIQENQNFYTISNIDVVLGYQADVSETYYVNYPKKTKDPLYYQFIKNGLLLNNTANSTQQELSCLQIDFGTPNTKEQSMFDMYANYGMYEKIDTIYESQLIDSIYVQVPIIRRTMAVKTTEEKANETLEEIKNIREAQRLLLTGEHEVDYSKLEYMIACLKEQEESYLSLFTGFTLSEDIRYTYYYPLPEKSDTVHLPLFSFTINNGIDKILQNEADIYSLQLINTHTTDPIQTFKENVGKQHPKQSETGFRYRIPEIYTFNLLRNNITVNTIGELPINQYGIINTLPQNVISFEIDPHTGNVLNTKFK